jgi:hypothetical protein
MYSILGDILIISMKIYPLTLFLVAFLAIGAYCQTSIAHEPAEDLPMWLKPGKHMADIMNIKSKITPRQIELSGKVIKAMKANAAWFRDSAENVSDSNVIYEKFGLTKAEFEEYSAMSDPKSKAPELIKSGEEELLIKQKGNIFSFQGAARLKNLDLLQFDITKNVALYNGKELVFSNPAGSEDENNPFKSPWHGYHYSFEDSETELDPLDASHLTATRYSFDIGQLKSNGKTIIMFMAMKINNGAPVQKLITMCMFE